MKVTDYIVAFLANKGITDCFGYPGGVICHYIDSVSKCSSMIAHANYNEQGASFAACGYAQFTGKPGVAYSTSGPGATNLVTGIANAYFDSIPCIFLTGQVDTYASGDGYPVRQRGFQETNIVSVAKDISKWAFRVDNPKQIRFCLEKAYYIATSGNPGPVILDLPADVQRADVDIDALEKFLVPEKEKIDYFKVVQDILSLIWNAKRPVIIAGNGIKQAGMSGVFRQLVKHWRMPVVSSLPAMDLLPYENAYNFGFIGTNGHRYANFLLGKADLIISLGSRLDIRQIGLAREKFAPQAQLIRADDDQESLNYHVHEDELCCCADLKQLVPLLLQEDLNIDFTDWVEVCVKIKNELRGYDDRDYNKLITELSNIVPDNRIFTIDVGQHQLWFAQSFKIKERQKVYMSSGHGAMGYSLPAAIGIYYGSKNAVIAFCGDGGIMMNLQELQFIKRENLPIKIICVNNLSLGMIRGFQNRNFNCNYQLTTEASGYLAPNLKKIAEAFDMRYSCVETALDMENVCFEDMKPELIELKISSETLLEPNFGRTGQIQDQLPYMDRSLYSKLMAL